MADPYITTLQAPDRLIEFGIDADSANTVTEPDLRLASDDLDSMGPFVGTRPADQARQFPREGESEVPDAVLDWVALRAYQITIDEAPGVRSEGAGRVSVSYFTPKLPQTERRMRALLKPLQRKTGSFGERARSYPSPGRKYLPNN